MTNEDRIAARIQRSKIQREKKRKERSQNCADLTELYTMKNAFKSTKSCRKGVTFKASVQSYVSQFITNNAKMIMVFQDGEILPLKNVKKETIRERGKERIILPIVFSDRVPQKIICDNSLVPIIKDILIYDNCASLPNKGTNFARNRLEIFLHKAIKQWGDEFYVLVTDFKDYFGSIPHSTCQTVLEKIYPDNSEIVELLMKIVRSYYEYDVKKNQGLSKDDKEEILQDIANNEYNGICLGSQVSQMLALLVPNKLDHYIKDKCGMKYYLRYMDDSVIFHNDKEQLQKLYEGMKQVAEELGLHYNEKKTRIVKVSKGFKFLKINYIVHGHKIIRTLDHNSVVRQRRKMKKMRGLVDEGKATYDNVYDSIQAWLAHSIYATHSYHSVKSMLKLYDKLFGGYKITKKYFKRTTRVDSGGKRYEILQDNKWSEFHWDRHY